MPAFIVKTPISDGKREYKPGETIDLDGETAAKMPWAVELKAPPAEKAEPAGEGDEAERKTRKR